jgi:primosomal protein N' (replication factor Y)
MIDIAHSNVDRLFTYEIPEGFDIRPGHRVLVPFGAGNKPVEGFVLETAQTFDEQEIRLKRVLKTLEPYTALTQEQIQLAYWIRDSYHCLLVDALRLMIPAQLRGGRVKEKRVSAVCIAPGVDAGKALASLKKKDGFSRAPVQSEILELLVSTKTPMSVADIAAFVPGASGAISTLIKKGFLAQEGCVTFRDPFGRGKFNPSAPMELTSAQRASLDGICTLMERRTGTCLLHGVTGSGKTEVYMQAIARAIREGGKAIVLVPEISLTPQAMDRFRGRFGERVAVLHSRLSPGERYDEWRRIRLGRVDVVIGARSAVFAPLENIRLIVVDEEHEPSYHSEITPRYGAAEVAARRAALGGAVLVLGSATPSVATYRRAKSGSYTLLELPERINESPMPEVQVVDMRREFLAGNNSIFSAALYKELERCFTAGEQAILFINRRGYSTFVSCRGCGYVMKCPDCDVSMTYHKVENAMKCHYCGRVARIPDACPQCGKPYLKYFGVGTQQVEEQLEKSFPGVRALRMDLDTTRTKDAHYEILSEFSGGGAQVLIGTQMIAKGLDIPNVTLVGVIAADSTLHIPDYRSGERTFQLITQVAGRAGRADKPGKVVIQSYTPEHPVIEFASRHDYPGFYEYEIALRRAALFPPFSLFARILFTGGDEDRLYHMSEAFADGLKRAVEDALAMDGANQRELLFIFAAPAPVRRRQGQYRYQVLLKLARTKHTAAALRAVYAYYDVRRTDEACGVEINPQDMF